MANLHIVSRQLCTYCNGTGLKDGLVCPQCGGSGYYQKLAYALPPCFCNSYEIYNLTEGGEYNALTDQQKDYFRMLISCGMVDLRIGSQMRNVLFSLFPSGSHTRTRLQTLIDEFQTEC